VLRSLAGWQCLRVSSLLTMPQVLDVEAGLQLDLVPPTAKRYRVHRRETRTFSDLVFLAVSASFAMRFRRQQAENRYEMPQSSEVTRNKQTTRMTQQQGKHKTK
jgi:hypothetical protein